MTRHEKEVAKLAKRLVKFKRLALGSGAPSSESDDIAMVMLICDENIRKAQSTSVRAFLEEDVEAMIRGLGESVYGEPMCPYVASWTDTRVKHVAAVVFRQLMRRTTVKSMIIAFIGTFITLAIVRLCGC